MNSLRMRRPLRPSLLTTLNEIIKLHSVERNHQGYCSAIIDTTLERVLHIKVTHPLIDSGSCRRMNKSMSACQNLEFKEVVSCCLFRCERREKWKTDHD